MDEESPDGRAAHKARDSTSVTASRIQCEARYIVRYSRTHAYTRTLVINRQLSSYESHGYPSCRQCAEGIVWCRIMVLVLLWMSRPASIRWKEEGRGASLEPEGGVIIAVRYSMTFVRSFFSRYYSVPLFFFSSLSLSLSLLFSRLHTSIDIRLRRRLLTSSGPFNVMFTKK